MDFTEIHQKVSSPTLGYFWLDLNPLTKLVMILCGAAASISSPVLFLVLHGRFCC